MNVWIQQGTVWDLQLSAQRGFRRVVKLFGKFKEDVYVTSGREGDHHPASLHYPGLAWDMRNGRAKKFSKDEVIACLPGGDKYWDVVFYDWGFHIEYDPK